MERGSQNRDELDATPEKRARKVVKERRKRVIKVASSDSPQKQEPKRSRSLNFGGIETPAEGSSGGEGPRGENDARGQGEGLGSRGPIEGGDGQDWGVDGGGNSRRGDGPGVNTGGGREDFYDSNDFFDPRDAAVSGGAFSIGGATSKPTQEDKRHAEEENWGAVRAALLSRFVETSKDRRGQRQEQSASLNLFVQEKVAAPPSHCSHCNRTAPDASFTKTASQSVLLVAQACRFLVAVPIFTCSGCGHKSHTHPLSVHAFPGTPVWGLRLWEVRGNQGHPTWFALDLLEFYDALTFNGKRGALSLESFCAAVEAVHEENGCYEPALSSDGFRKGFGKAWEELGYILHAAQDPHTFGVKQFGRSPFSSCAACQEAGVESPLHSVYLDGCFKMKHLAGAGAASRFRQPHIEDCTLLPDQAVRGFLDLPESAAPAGENTCSEFKADSVYGASKPSIYDISGYMGVFCRHGVLGLGANVFHGERYGYATLLLLTLLAVWKVPVLFCWYDIGCRYKLHLGAWLALQSAAVFQIQGSALPFDLVLALASAMVILVPPFHQYAHSSSCQAQNSGKHAKGAGRAVGEPPENAWSFFGTFNKQLQHRSLAGRADFLARLRGCWNEQKARCLPELLVRIHMKSRLQIATSSEDLKKVKEEASIAGVNLDEVSGAAQAAAQVHVEPGRAWSVDYVRLLLQHNKLVAESVTSLPSLDVLFAAEGSGFQKLRSSSEFSKRIKSRLAALEARHKDQIGVDSTGKVQRWKVDDQAFAEAYKLLRLVEMQRLQRQIESLVHELLYAQFCASKLGDRPGDLKKLRKEIDRIRARVRQAFDMLKRWGLDFTATAAGLQRGDDRSASESNVQSWGSVEDLEKWRVEDTLTGRFPWLEEGSVSGHGVSEGLRLKHRLALLLDDQARGEEEKKLVELEMARTLARYKVLLEGLHNRLKALREETEQLTEGPALSYALGVVEILQSRLQQIQRLTARARSLFERTLKEHLTAADLENIIVGERRAHSSVQSDWDAAEVSEDEDDL